MVNFDLNKKDRIALWQETISQLESYYEETNALDVAPSLDKKTIDQMKSSLHINATISPEKAVKRIIENLKQFAVHTPHPMYYGLYNPRTNFASILADLVIGVFNPQLAAWSHSPFANEIESYIIQEIGKKFGYSENDIDGTFATGGAEANLTALLCALNNQYPQFAKEGVFGMSKKPIIYCSSDAHHSIHKAAKTVGLGYQCVTAIPLDENLALDPHKLEEQIENDLAANFQPFMIVATAGTTGTGVIDDLAVINKIAKQHQLWFHVDGAYGGGAILNQKLKSFLKGIEHSDSITFDAHKWMSVSMGTSMFITSHKDMLHKTFRISAEYMPKEGKELDIVDPFTHSIQWSRKSLGVKVYLSLLIFGWDGYDEVIGHQTEMGNYFREKLMEHNWNIKNKTPFPVICFTDDQFDENADFVPFICNQLIQSGTTWLSVYPVDGRQTLRVCVTNYKTDNGHIDALITSLNKARTLYNQSGNN